MTKLKNNHNASSSSNHNNSTTCLLRKTNLPKGYFKKRKSCTSGSQPQQLTQSHKHHNHSTSLLLPPVTALAKTTLASTIKSSYKQHNILTTPAPSSPAISKKHRTSQWNCLLIYALVISHCTIMLSAFETEYSSMQSTIDRAIATTVRTPAQMTETDGGK